MDFLCIIETEIGPPKDGSPVARSPYTKAQLDFLKQQKQQDRPNEIIEKTRSLGDVIIRFLGRGEVAYVQSGTQAMLVEAFPGAGVISRSSIRGWDDGTRPTHNQCEEIIQAFFSVFQKLGHSDPKAL